MSVEGKLTADAWGSRPTPSEAANHLREYAAKQRRLHGTCPPGDNIFEDAAAVIDRLAALALTEKSP